VSLTKRERQSLRDVVDNEGFDYAFVNYSDFAEIEDAEFQQKRAAYVKAQQELGDMFEEDA
jgi:hypothetical protein